MTLPSTGAASRRVQRTYVPERAKQIGTSVRAVDRSLNLDGGGHVLLDTTLIDGDGLVVVADPDYLDEGY
jgi:hypothetical protein